MNIYAYNPATASGSSYTYAGCVNDGLSRALTGYSVTTGSMTVSTCLSTCASHGYIYAGIEFGAQCFCGNSLQNGLGTSISSSACNVPCNGDGGSQCG